MLRWWKNTAKTEKSRSYSLLKKTFISLLIMVLIVGINKINFPLTRQINQGIKFVLTYEYDFSRVFEKIDVAGFIQENIDSEFLRRLFESQKSVQTFSNSEGTGIQDNEDNDIIMPIQGEITSEYGMRMHPVHNEVRPHNGIDIAAEEGEAVRVVMDGVVAKVWEDEEFGKTVKVKHPNNIETLYAHCSEILVKEGEVVNKGDVIARAGSTGNALNSHLHFEVWVDGKPVDPLEKIIDSK